MKEQVEEFLANLLISGFSRMQAVEKGFNYAMALLNEQEREGVFPSATMMFQAGELVKNALPGAYRIVELRNRMH